MIDYNGAQEYFGQHVRGSVWAAFSEEVRRAAVVHARRVLSRALSRDLRDDLEPYVEGDRYRDDFAVYEQAIYMLETGRVASGTAGMPYPVAVKPSGRSRPAKGEREKPLIAPEALRWLGWTGASVLRG